MRVVFWVESVHFIGFFCLMGMLVFDFKWVFGMLDIGGVLFIYLLIRKC